MLSVEEQATGCTGASSYRQYARDLGYKHCEVLDWTSSAGDWSFVVSKNGREWFLLWQTNNYPRPGFSHELGDQPYYGTADEVMNYIWEERQ
jgi:hypothetical protein